jgi:hypothetical protein
VGVGVTDGVGVSVGSGVRVARNVREGVGVTDGRVGDGLIVSARVGVQVGGKVGAIVGVGAMVESASTYGGKGLKNTLGRMKIVP